MTAPAGVPRLDYNPTTGQALGLLIEESRTNLVTYSSDFSNAVWSKNFYGSWYSSTVTSNTVIAPDGTQTGCSFNVYSAAIGTFGITQRITAAASTTYTFSIFVRLGTLTDLTLISSTYLSGTLVRATAASANITSQLSSTGWVRVNLSATLAATGENQISFTVGSSTDQRGKTFYIWGAQLEAGSFATSYIHTVATTITRAADQASMTGTNFSSWYNQAQGSLYVETIAVFGTNNIGTASLSDGTSNNSINIYGNSTSSYMDSLVNGIGTVGNYSYGLTHYPFKNIYSYLTNNTITTSDGNIPLVDSSCAIPIVNRLIIGSIYGGTNFFLNGHIRKLTYYPVALSSSNLVALTS
jgi:hypothetical protein